MISQSKIIFCGLDEWAFEILLASHDLKINAVNYLAELGCFKSLNPIDLLFKRLYLNLYHGKLFFLNKLLISILNCSYRFGSRMTRKYYFYVKALVHHSIAIIDFSNEYETIKYIHDNHVELIVLSNWWLLSEDIIYAPKHGTINIHPSKLPEYRGSVPTLWSLKFKRENTAVTLIKLNSKIDDGDIISQHELIIDKNEDSISLENKCCSLLNTHLVADVKNYLSGKLVPVKQDQSKASVTAKYYEYLKIDWAGETCAEIVNKIKLYPHLWPIDCCYTHIKNMKIILYNAELCHTIPDSIQRLNTESTGTSKIHRNILYVKTLDGIIKLKLFSDISMFDSVKLLFKRNRILFTQLGTRKLSMP